MRRYFFCFLVDLASAIAISFETISPQEALSVNACAKYCHHISLVFFSSV